MFVCECAYACVWVDGWRKREVALDSVTGTKIPHDNKQF
jgi:hypothetical protein